MSDTAIILHMFYPELWDEFKKYLINPAQSYDLFVSIPEGVIFNQDLLIDSFPDARICHCVNRGRDMAPFIKIFSLIYPKGYKYICKVHTKKSLHSEDGSVWRTEIVDELLGSYSQIEEIKQHLNIDNIGIIGPKNHIVSTRYFMGNNRELISELSTKLNLSYAGEYFNFVAGSMFWCKPSAIAPILKLDLHDTDFPEETGQTDGTLAHALERLIGLVAYKQGLKIIQTQTFDSEINDDYFRFSKFRQKPLIRIAAWLDRKIPEDGLINRVLKNLVDKLSWMKHRGL